MSTLSYIHGPCLVKRGGYTIYLQDGLKRELKTKTGNVRSDLHGEVDQFAISRMFMLAGKPVDAIANLSAFFGIGISNIGESIFKGTARSVASVSAANPAVVTFTAAHNLGPSGTTISGTFAGTTAASAAINGTQTLTITGASTGTVNVNVTSAQASAAGTFTPDSEPLQIVSKNDNAIYTFERSGIYAPPKLKLSPAAGIFASEMQWAALGSLTKTPTATDYFQSAVSQAFADSSFDQTKIKRYRYTGAYGSSPYDAIATQDGFDIDITHEVEELADVNVGIGDIILKSVTAKSEFAPTNLTQAQIDTLLNVQGSAALRPGDSIAGAGSTDLVITGTDGSTTFAVSLYAHGFSEAALLYATGKHRAGRIAGMSRRTWTGGTANALYALTIS